MMNTIRGIVNLSLRGYRTNRGRESTRRVKPPRQIEMIQPGMPVENIFDEEDEDPEDLDQFASDFQNVAQYDKMHEREMEIEKAKHLTQIVKRKYFKKEEPAMLTWAEKEQIRRLHSQDPEEWTPEALSDSFPASRDAVVKILKSKWTAKSVEVVERYEQTVKKNWDLLKSGKLEIDPQLEAHLSKFKDRKIQSMDRETIAKTIIPPKPVFPKPQSQMFSSIIQSYLDANPAKEDDELPDKKKTKKLNAPKKNSFKQIISDDSVVEETSEKLTATKKLVTAKKIPRSTPFTFDQFLQTHAESVREDEMTPVDRVIVDEVKQKATEKYKSESLILQSDEVKQQTTEKNNTSKSLLFQSASPVAAWKQQDETSENLPENFDKVMPISGNEKSTNVWQVPEETSKESAVSKIRSDTSVKPELANILEGSLETGIIARHKTEAAQQDDYPDFIKIPRKKYKRGVTYKVEDRYYDDDGELLYRVPGLKT